MWLLTTLLYERAHELLGVILEDVVDLVEDRIDVVVELLLAFGIDLGSLDLLFVDVALARRPVLLLGHVSTLSTSDP